MVSFCSENYDVPRPVSPKVKDPEHTCEYEFELIVSLIVILKVKNCLVELMSAVF